jgi:hypothetical protein
LLYMIMRFLIIFTEYLTKLKRRDNLAHHFKGFSPSLQGRPGREEQSTS